jgi:hypothetical protein
MLDLFDLLTLTPPYGDDAAAVAPSTGCGTDMIAAGMDWLTGQLQVAASRPVVYRRGVAEIPLCAAFGRTKLMLGNGLGAVRIEWTDRDFLIPTASLVLAGQPIRPQRGDRIVTTDGATTETFEVLPYADEPHWRWSDPYKRMMRVHTRRIKTEAV